MTDLLGLIRDSVVGADDAVDGPFGRRRVIYADYTASGRALGFIEDYIRDVVLPLYANTHTESSGTGLQTTRLREEARSIVRRSVGASEDHAVIFCGNGSTGAIDHLIRILGLRIPAELDDRYALSDRIPETQRPVVFIGPFEHHSNELPWRESICDVVTIAEDADGHIDLRHLDAELEAHADRPLKIGSFSAASNVTGIISDTAAISSLLHRHGALSFWDFAAAAPYVGVDMGPLDESDPGSYKDAIFLSPHKFIGGPGTPGVLVVRRELLANRVPAIPGGGTVWYVSADDHHYLVDPEHREEGGTPNIVGCIRTGLVFQLKHAVGIDTIREREDSFIRRAIGSWSEHPNIQVLGNHEADRLSIVSFTVRHGDRYLHHNYVVALLNDLFGIQSRGGCSCAGPYGHRLLGIDIETSHQFEREIGRGCEGIKPGWVRVNFNYFIAEETFRYIVDAVHLVAEEGWKMLPRYTFEPLSGLWRHRDGPAEPPFSLDQITYSDDGMTYPNRRIVEPSKDLDAYLEDARRTLAAAGPHETPPAPTVVDDDFEQLRWFHLPEELQAELEALR